MKLLFSFMFSFMFSVLYMSGIARADEAPVPSQKKQACDYFFDNAAKRDFDAIPPIVEIFDAGLELQYTQAQKMVLVNYFRSIIGDDRGKFMALAHSLMGICQNEVTEAEKKEGQEVFGNILGDWK